MPGPPALQDAVAEVAGEAVSHLLAARSLRPQLSKQACSSLLPATVADMILQRLQRLRVARLLRCECGAALLRAELVARGPQVLPALHVRAAARVHEFGPVFRLELAKWDVARGPCRLREHISSLT